MIKEIWKDINCYEGIYQVSDLGRVKSLNYNHTGKEVIMKNYENKNGYMYIFLYSNGKCNNLRIHRLVCSAFIDNPENKKEVNHKNGIKSDNRVENLEWATHSENQKHAYNTGLKKSIWTGKFGKDNYLSIPVCRYTKLGEYIDEFDGSMDAKRKTRINNSHILECCKGKRKSAGGYIWKYKQL